MDEVAQSTESAALVPIVTRGCERVVLAGDHCQLPPSVQSAEAEARGLSSPSPSPDPGPSPSPSPSPNPSPSPSPNPRAHPNQARGLSLSLFGRLISQGVRPFFLDLQFRAHPKLAEFSSEMIYGGRLRSGVTAQA